MIISVQEVSIHTIKLQYNTKYIINDLLTNYKKISISHTYSINHKADTTESFFHQVMILF